MSSFSEFGLRKLALAGACITLGGAAQAQNTGYTWSGQAELGYFSYLGAESSALLSGDVTLQGPLTGNIGFSVGVDSVIAAGSWGTDVYWTPYATLDFRTGNGVLRVGAPRFAVDDHIHAPLMGGSRVFRVAEWGIITGAASYGRASAYLSNLYAAGLRYDGSVGNLSYAASAHYLFGDGGSAPVVQFGATWRQDGVKLFGGLEYVGDGESIVLAKLGAEYDTGMFRVGAMVNHLATDVGVTGGTAWIGVRPMENLDLTVTAMVFDDFFGYGLAAEYSLSGGYYVRAGAAVFSDVTTVDIGVGIKF